MNNPLDKILTEWAYRVHDGTPDPSNSYHVVQLEQYLNELRLPRSVVQKVLEKVRKYKDNKMNQDLGRVGEPWGSEGEPSKDDTPTEKEKPSRAVADVAKNRSDIFNNQVSGKGGGTTSLQEEIAGISRELAQKHPNDTPEQHQQRVTQFIKDNYGDTKYGSQEKMISGLIKKSASGQKTMMKIKSNPAMKFKDKQPDGYPLNITFTDGGTEAVRNNLEEKLKNAKTPEEKAHYKRELKYFKKHATSETGVEGDGDTAIMYEDDDGNTRVVYISNKQTLSDPHSNATVKSAAEAIKSSRVEGANEGALIDRLDGSVGEAIAANKDYVKDNRRTMDENREEINKAPITKIAAKTLTGRAEFTDKTSRKYIDKCKKNKQIKEYIEKNKLDINNDDHIVQAAMSVAGTGDADELNDSTKQAPNKLLHKITNTTASVRIKMQRLIDKGMSPEEAAAKVANSKQNGKPLMGGNLSPEDCVSIYNNKGLERLEEHSQKRKNKMDEAHENMYNSMTELDIAHYIEQGMTEEEAIEKYKNEGGPNEQTYTNSFMKRMHWDRYLDGVDDDKKMIEVGDKSYSPKDFRECLASLTNFDGNGSLKEHISKTMRVKPGTQQLSFTSKGKEVHIGTDTWRTAGDLSKIAGGLGNDMKKCLGDK